MKAIMRDEDRRAVDLLMDRVPTASGKTAGQSVYALADAQLRERVALVGKTLSILDNMPEADFPADLAAKTLRLVAQSSYKTSGRLRHRHLSTFSQHPTA